VTKIKKKRKKHFYIYGWGQVRGYDPLGGLAPLNPPMISNVLKVLRGHDVPSSVAKLGMVIVDLPRARSCTSKTFGGLTHSFIVMGR